MSKGLEALRNIKREKPTFFSAIYDGDMWKEDIEIIENELKALEIIKEYPFVVIPDCRLDYNEQSDLVKEKLTQEQYDLLKEVLL